MRHGLISYPDEFKHLAYPQYQAGSPYIGSAPYCYWNIDTLKIKKHSVLANFPGIGEGRTDVVLTQPIKNWEGLNREWPVEKSSEFDALTGHFMGQSPHVVSERVIVSIRDGKSQHHLTWGTDKAAKESGAALNARISFIDGIKP